MYVRRRHRRLQRRLRLLGRGARVDVEHRDRGGDASRDDSESRAEPQQQPAYSPHGTVTEEAIS